MRYVQCTKTVIYLYFIVLAQSCNILNDLRCPFQIFCSKIISQSTRFDLHNFRRLYLRCFFIDRTVHCSLFTVHIPKNVRVCLYCTTHSSLNQITFFIVLESTRRPRRLQFLHFEGDLSEPCSAMCEFQCQLGNSITEKFSFSSRSIKKKYTLLICSSFVGESPQDNIYRQIKCMEA